MFFALMFVDWTSHQISGMHVLNENASMKSLNNWMNNKNPNEHQTDSATACLGFMFMNVGWTCIKSLNLILIPCIYCINKILHTTWNFFNFLSELNTNLINVHGKNHQTHTHHCCTFVFQQNISQPGIDHHTQLRSRVVSSYSMKGQLDCAIWGQTNCLSFNLF